MQTKLEKVYFDTLPKIQYAIRCGKDDDKRQTTALAVWQWFAENWRDDRPIDSELPAIRRAAEKLLRSRSKDVFGACKIVSVPLELVPAPLPSEVNHWHIEQMPNRLAVFARAILACDGHRKRAATMLGCHVNTITNRLAQCERWLRDHNQVI